MTRIILLITVAFFAMQSQASTNKDYIRIVTTTSPIASIFGAIGKDKVRISSISNAQECAHHYSPKPSQLFSLRHADLFVYINDEFETHVKTNLKQVQSEILMLSSLKGLNILTHKNQKDWHIWLELDNVTIIASAALHKFIELKPNAKDYFISNYNIFTAKIQEIKSRLAKINIGNPIYLSPELQYLFKNLPNINPIYIEQTDSSIASLNQLKEIVALNKPKCIFSSNHINLERIQAIIPDVKIAEIQSEEWSYIKGYDILFAEYMNKIIHTLEVCK